MHGSDGNQQIENVHMEILAHPNPALKQTASPVDPGVDTDLPRLVKVMAQAMYDAPGIGLAAPQLGVMKRVFIFDIDDRLGVVCNPVIVERSDETEIDDEGCLSLPGINVPVERSIRVVCEGIDIKGSPVRIEGTDLVARMLQHETDHLDGVLIIDRATPGERRAAMRRYMESAGR